MTSIKKLFTFTSVTLFALISFSIGSGPANAAPPVGDCNIQNQDVSYCDFSNQDFFNGDLSNKNMSHTSLVGLYSRFSYWDSTDLTNADLTDATFFYAWMANANFTNADLTDANLTHTDLRNADFTGANLTGVISGSINGVPKALPAGWKFTVGYLVGPGANLSEADLTGADLDGVDLTGAVLTGVKSGGVTGSPTLPDGWILDAGYLIGPGADLSYSNLNNVTVWDIDFSGVNLTGSSVDGAAFIYPKSFAGVRSGGMTGAFHYGIPFIVNGYLIAPGVNLEGANLQGAKLDNLDLSQANLRGADLTGASLVDAKFTGSNLINTDFTEADLTRADFRGATIRNSRFNGATMALSNFSETDIYSSEFYNANFQAANFLLANLHDPRSMYVSGTIISFGNTDIVDGVLYSRWVDNFMPAVNGVAMLGNTLNATTQVAVPVGGKASYQWFRSGVAIPNATTSSYLVQADDFGGKITVAVTMSKSGSISRTDVSQEVSVLAKPMVQSAVKVTGKSKVGSKLTVKTSAWAPGATISYQWLRNGKAIKGAKKANYTTTAKDKKAKISVNVTQRSKGYANSSKISNSLTIK
ncbi:MAG: pentapeptide repeat-containing protein [Microbacteriaceae bacterium]|nr:pentapeptide repeat-containing protein [Microbacteriaceae bacterium]